MRGTLKSLSGIRILILGMTLILTPVILSKVNPRNYNGRVNLTESVLEERNTSAIAQMLGEFRVGMSDIMFLKTERYLHLGVAYAPHKDEGAIIVDKNKSASENIATTDKGNEKEHHPENKSGAITHNDEHESEDHQGHDHEHEHSHLNQNLISDELKEGGNAPGRDIVHVEGSDEEYDINTAIKAQQSRIKTADAHGHEEHEHGETATIIREPQKDWRGFIGSLEREVKPWRDPTLPHLLSPGAELLPWYRLITLSNPHNIRGYVVGTYWLMVENTKDANEEAIKFINEGIKNNPDSFQLYLMRGRALLRQKDKSDALSDFTKSRKLGLKHRPAGGKTGDKWTDQQEEDFLFAVRYEIIMLRDAGKTDAAYDLAQKGIQYSPKDRSLGALLSQLSKK